jgi:endonuclease/exonuclease/phosphatase family metal-dependent hydrolase
MTWNLRGRSSPDLDRVASVIGELRPDVVGLQEVRSRQAEVLAAATGLTHTFWTLKHRPGGGLLWWRAEGLAVLSRSPLEKERWVELSRGESTRSHHRRIAQVVDLTPHRARPIRVVNCHLATRGTQVRHEQALRLAELVTADPLTAVVGDLNVDEDPAVFGPLAAAGLHSVGRDVGASFPADGPNARLDHILLPAAARALDAVAPVGGPEWAALSDHLPVVVELEW